MIGVSCTFVQMVYSTRKASQIRLQEVGISTNFAILKHSELILDPVLFYKFCSFHRYI